MYKLKQLKLKLALEAVYAIGPTDLIRIQITAQGK